FEVPELNLPPALAGTSNGRRQLELEIAGRLARQRAEIGNRSTHGVAAPAVHAGAVAGISGVDRLDRQIAADLADDLQSWLRVTGLVEQAHRFCSADDR